MNPESIKETFLPMTPKFVGGHGRFHKKLAVKLVGSLLALHDNRKEIVNVVAYLLGVSYLTVYRWLKQPQNYGGKP